MSQVQKLATQLAWADRKENGRREPAKDRWCIRTLMLGGHITYLQYGVAQRLSALIERGQGQGSTGRMEFVDGGGADPHARQMDAAMCDRAAENAMQSVRRSLSGPDAERRRQALIVALEFPHVTTAQASRRSGYGYGNHRSFIAGLGAALDLLVIHFDAIDRDRANWSKKALDGRAEHLHPERENT